MSVTGHLVYIPGKAVETVSSSMLVQVAADGSRVVLTEIKGMAWFPRYSPDGARVAFALSGSGQDLGDAADIWVVNVARGARTRVTFGGNNRYYPIWTRDGTRLTFASGSTATNTVQWALADGSGGLQALTEVQTRRFPTSWSPDGRALAYYVGGNADSRDIWMLQIEGEQRTHKPFVETPFEERGAIFSPNGRWVAYVSNKSDQNDIYARPYPGPGEEITISVGGGQEPVWGPSGRQLFYRRGGTLMVVGLEERGGSLVASAPSALFEASYRLDTGGAAGGVANYDISPDGKRFVMVEEPRSKGSTTERARLHVILNWVDEVRSRLPAR